MMEFLKDILGEELFNQVNEKIESHNKDEANKDNQIKIANLAKGEYVSKGKFDSLQEAMNGKDAEILQAKNMLDELKKASKGNEDLQAKFSAYEQENAQLLAQLKETKIKSAIKVALLSEKAVDVDYLTFKLNEKLAEQGKSLDVDENDNIKGWDDMLSGLKTQFPAQFESPTELKDKKIEERKIPEGDKEQKITKEEFAKMGYKSRVELKESNPELYANLAN